MLVCLQLLVALLCKWNDRLVQRRYRAGQFHQEEEKESLVRSHSSIVTAASALRCATAHLDPYQQHPQLRNLLLPLVLSYQQAQQPLLLPQWQQKHANRQSKPVDLPQQSRSPNRSRHARNGVRTRVLRAPKPPVRRGEVNVRKLTMATTTTTMTTKQRQHRQRVKQLHQQQQHHHQHQSHHQHRALMVLNQSLRFVLNVW